MGQFLKEYHLYDDMSRLNNEAYFSPHFQINQACEFLCSLRQDCDVKAHDMTLKIFLAALRKAKERTVYITLKWLVCLHPIIECLSNGKVIERVYESLSRMETPRVQDKIDEYIYQGIVRPYIHYLAKSCLLKTYEGDEVGSVQFNKENIGSKNIRNNLGFMRVNLARSVLPQLVPTLVELHGYLNTYYPLLSKIPLLLHRDITILLDEIRKDTKGESNKIITLGQLQDIRTQIDQLEINGADDSYLLVEVGEMSAQMSLFMESGGKEAWTGRKGARD